MPGLDGFWVHPHAGVLAPSVCSPSTAPTPTAELVELLRPLLARPHCAGLGVTVHEPGLDPDGTAGALLAERGRGRLCAILTGSAPGRLTARRVPWSS
ncbi:hypothetical protein Scel_12930 [Streptomyces cellostaticus]|nr:hypothetical protein Scel_12930 [Streptomyces cellostaticus]